MQKHWLLIIFFLPAIGFSQINQTDSKGMKQGYWKKQYPNGRLMYEGTFKDNKPTGEWKRYHENGALKANLMYLPGSDSVKTILFDGLGVKIADGVFMGEKKEGKWNMYLGPRKIADEFYVKGQKHGVARRYYETGEILEESHWESGSQTGNYQLFLTNGKPYLQCKFSHNKRNGIFLTFHENGLPETQGAYVENLKNGDWKYFGPEGKLLYTLKYNTGEIQNPAVLDSLENLQMKDFEKNRGLITDPEKYMDNPLEYMNKMKMVK